MAAPVVTRPDSTEIDQTPAQSSMDTAEIAHWARLFFIVCLILVIGGLVAFAVVTMNERKKADESRKNWDEVYKSLKEKTRTQDVIAGLESAAEKVKGTPAHAYVLLQLGDRHFEQSVNPVKSAEERAASLEKATKVYKLVGTTEPYSSNPIFGPLAIESTAMALEQARNYDEAIALLEEHMSKLEAALKKQGTHNLLNDKMLAQLGRLYWLRSQTGSDDAKKQADREKAQTTLTQVVQNKPDKDKGGETNWRQQAEYIKSLVDARGKGLPEGAAIPAPKPPAAPAVSAVPNAPQIVPAAQPSAIKVEEPKKPEEVKKADPPKTDVPPAAPGTNEGVKKDVKKDDKQGLLNHPSRNGGSDHVSYADIQRMLKEGKTALCLCVRCDTTELSTRAKLFE